MTQQEMDTHTADRLWAEYARTRDPRTRDALVHQFERLAYSLANRFARRGAALPRGSGVRSKSRFAR